MPHLLQMPKLYDFVILSKKRCFRNCERIQRFLFLLFLLLKIIVCLDIGAKAISAADNIIFVNNEYYK